MVNCSILGCKSRSEEQEQSYKCLNNNSFEHKKCEECFENYNICKKFWGKISNDRRAKGIYPYLPEAVERRKTKSDFMDKIRKSLE